MSELSAHQALADFLHNRAAPRLPDLAFTWHTALESAGGKKTKSGIPLDVLKEKHNGTVKGVWDWLYLGPNLCTIGDNAPYFFMGIAIELKSTSAYRKKDHDLSDAQKLWRELYIRNGWYTAIYPEQDWHKTAVLLVQWVGGDERDFDFGG